MLWRSFAVPLPLIDHAVEIRSVFFSDDNIMQYLSFELRMPRGSVTDSRLSTTSLALLRFAY